MKRLFYVVAIAMLTTLMVGADSIRIGTRVHRDVYIREAKHYYYVYQPDSGTVERISKRRSNISKVDISDDAAYRQSLWERYESNRDGSHGDETEAVTPPVKELDGSLAKIQRQRHDLAEFETQLAYWKLLPEELRQAIASGLQVSFENRQAGRAEERSRALDQAAELDVTRVEVTNKLLTAEQARDDAVWAARSEDDSDFYLRAYENSRGYVGPYYYYYRDEEDHLHAIPYWWYTEDPSLYDAALIERAETDHRVQAAEQTFRGQASVYRDTLTSVERAQSQRERDARAAAAKATDERLRFERRAARVRALENAVAEGHLPQFEATVLGSWSGASEMRSEVFQVDAKLWRIEVEVLGGAAPDAVSVTLHRADTDQPFTRISGPDFLGMRARILDTPGAYYLTIDVAPSLTPIRYRIRTESLQLSLG